MNSPESSATQPSALKADIRAVEVRIRQRRDNIRLGVGRVTNKLRDNVISPPTLVAAGLLGVAMHRSPRPNALRLLAILQTANAVLRRVLTATSRARAAP